MVKVRLNDQKLSDFWCRLDDSPEIFHCDIFIAEVIEEHQFLFARLYVFILGKEELTTIIVLFVQVFMPKSTVIFAFEDLINQIPSSLYYL